MIRWPLVFVLVVVLVYLLACLKTKRPFSVTVFVGLMGSAGAIYSAVRCLWFAVKGTPAEIVEMAADKNFPVYLGTIALVAIVFPSRHFYQVMRGTFRPPVKAEQDQDKTDPDVRS